MAVASLVSFFFAHEDGVHGFQAIRRRSLPRLPPKGVLTAYQVFPKAGV